MSHAVPWLGRRSGVLRWPDEAGGSAWRLRDRRRRTRCRTARARPARTTRPRDAHGVVDAGQPELRARRRPARESGTAVSMSMPLCAQVQGLRGSAAAAAVGGGLHAEGHGKRASLRTGTSMSRSSRSSHSGPAGRRRIALAPALQQLDLRRVEVAARRRPRWRAPRVEGSSRSARHQRGRPRAGRGRPRPRCGAGGHRQHLRLLHRAATWRSTSCAPEEGVAEVLLQVGRGCR